MLAWTAAFLAFSYLPYLAPRRALDLPGLTIYWTVWCSTAIILCDAACNRIEGRSLLTTITGNWKNFAVFVLTGTASGLFLDGTAQWLGKLWIYPFWSQGLYGGSFVPGFCAYWLLLAETYFLARGVLRRIFPRSATRRPPGRKPLRGICGLALSGAGVALAVHDYAACGGYRFALAAPSPAHARFSCFPIIAIGLWLVLECVALRQGKMSLLDASLDGTWLPACAVLAAGWASGILMESANAAGHFWRYTNWPLANMVVDGIPVLVLVLWPMQYVVFLSFFCVFGNYPVWE